MSEKADLGLLLVTRPPLIIIRNQAVRDYFELPEHVTAILAHCPQEELEELFEQFSVDTFDLEEEKLDIPIRIAGIVALPQEDSNAIISVH